MEFFHKLYDLLRHLADDDKWTAMIDYVGIWKLYTILMTIIFCETGLVILPFLPGDSLLFGLGAVGARLPDVINLPLITVLLIVAAVVGDAVNYWIGYKFGPAIFNHGSATVTAAPTAAGVVDYATGSAREKRLADRLLNREHLDKAHAFYEKYGAKTIILARFVPVVRTFAPFVAGIGKMSYAKFLLYNVIGGIAWVLLCVTAGYFFGQFEFVKKRFELVIVAIVIISVLPMAIEFWKARKDAKRAAFEVVPEKPVN